jgi:ATP-binding cassette subfamily F protein 3
VKPFEGDIDDYRRQVLRSSDDADKRKGMPPEARPSSRDQRREAAERREALAPLRKKIRELEKQIETLQRDVQSIDRRLADGSLYATRPEEATRLAQNRAERAKTLAAIEESWLTISEEVSSLELAS